MYGPLITAKVRLRDPATSEQKISHIDDRDTGNQPKRPRAEEMNKSAIVGAKIFIEI
jgi:hypothetical protein